MCTWKARAGWVDAAAVLRSVNKAACKEGVEYIVATVERLLISDDDVCYGVLVSEKGGRAYETIAKKSSMGADIPRLLAESAPDQDDIKPRVRLQAVGVPMSIYVLHSSATVDFRDASIVVKLAGEAPNEAIPPRDDGLFKFVAGKSYTNKQKIDSFMMSVPPKKGSPWRWSENGDGIPQQLKNDIDTARRELYGK
ncbi:hypothetical protein EMCG_04852 [[Emmonsia] crescens]|uniref:Uncharacterized protein n=1 Tax=[Emmonsia] crescens TaxID=73230 RepID=A0A0G2HR65_9EURO|nr:hypothetical protein EMCG_04852 [Emmonsia crescens UAMH 3008]